MKKLSLYILFALVAVTATSLASCSESDDTTPEFPDWKNTNAAYFDKEYNAVKSYADAGNADYKVLCAWNLNDEVATHTYDHVLVNVLKAGNGSGMPFYTDSVKVHYSGRLLPSTTYPEGLVFDQSWTGDYNLKTMKPATMGVAGTVVGFSTALQHMHIGDRWQITIPQQLAYGSASTPGAAYSTLIFDVTLVAYYRCDSSTKLSSMKDGNAKRGEWVYE